VRYRRFGTTDLYVSELSLGTMTFGGKGIWEIMGGIGGAEAESLVGTALDAGVNLIDTADAYSEGESEEILGAALAALDHPRDSYNIATKVRLRGDREASNGALSRAHIIESAEASLRRMKLDVIDIFQIQGADCSLPVDETMDALDELVRSGKVRFVGFCNLPAWLAMKALAYSDAHGLSRFVSAQMYYSIAGRDIEREVVPCAQDQGLALLSWAPLAGGLLSGKFTADEPGPEGARRSLIKFPPVSEWRARVVLAALHEVAQEMGISMARVALAWLLTRPFITSIIIGARTHEQLADDLAAADVTLAPEHLVLLDNVSTLPPEYPGWMMDVRKKACLMKAQTL
jgi:aryl-alcohol dehydrogenase-like predicted oxidoreductase